MFDFGLPDASKFINIPLIKEPMNWAIVFVVASIWLLAFHTIMQGFGAMQSTATPTIGAGPGQIAAPPVPTTGSFAPPNAPNPALNVFDPSSSWLWTDGFESKWAEDGWTGMGGGQL